MNSVELLKLISSRRSIRSFLPDREISDKILLRIIEAGIWAPTGTNQQELRFVVVRQPQLLKEFLKFKKIGMPSAIVLIYIDFGNYYSDYGFFVKYTRHKRHLPYIDTGLSIMNMMLMAESMSLRSIPLNISNYLCYDALKKRNLPARILRLILKIMRRSLFGLVFFDEFTKKLGIDTKQYIPAGALAFGYSDKIIDLETFMHGKKLIKRNDVKDYILANF